MLIDDQEIEMGICRYFREEETVHYRLRNFFVFFLEDMEGGRPSHQWSACPYLCNVNKERGVEYLSSYVKCLIATK